MIKIECKSHRAREKLLKMISNKQSYYFYNHSKDKTMFGTTHFYNITENEFELVKNIKGLKVIKKNIAEEDISMAWT